MAGDDDSDDAGPDPMGGPTALPVWAAEQAWKKAKEAADAAAEAAGFSDDDDGGAEGQEADGDSIWPDDMPDPWLGPAAPIEWAGEKAWEKVKGWFEGAQSEPTDPEDPDGDRDKDEQPPTEVEDDSSFWDWAVFGFGVVWAAWEIWQWLGTDPSITLDEVDPDPLWTWTNVDDDEVATVIEVEYGVFVAPTPFAARVADPMMHGGAALPGPGSPDVLVGGLPALRATDQVACPVTTPVPHAPGPWKPSQVTVLINGVPALRAGDYVIEMVGGPNPIIMGATTVEIGPPAPPVVWHRHLEVEDESWWDDIDWPIKFRWTKIEFVDAKGKLVAGLSQDGPFIQLEATVDAAHVYGGVDTDFDVIDTIAGDVNLKTSTDAEVIVGRLESKARVHVSWAELALWPITGKAPRLQPSGDFEISPIAKPKADLREIDIDFHPHD